MPRPDTKDRPASRADGAGGRQTVTPIRARAPALTLAVAVLFPAAATAQKKPTDPEARALFEQGLRDFEARNYEEAIDAFEDAYEIEERPEILYALAQAERLSGDCPTALELYERFLETEPPGKHAAAARTGIERCERALASRPLGLAERRGEEQETEQARGARPPPAALDPAPEAPARTSPESERRPWYRDPIGAPLCAAGAVGLAAGGTYFFLSGKDAGDARRAPSYQAYAKLMDRAESRRTVAWIGLGAGAALLSAGALRYWLRGDARGATAVAVSGGQGSVGLVAAGRF